jgi:hypothetical protein
MVISPVKVKSVPTGSEKGMGLRSAAQPTTGWRSDAVS